MNRPNMFACTYKGCDKAYFTIYSLQRHCLISHRKSKRFSCKICKKILSSNQNLKEHLSTHSQEKPIKCPFADCQEVFRQSSQLSTHKKLHHRFSKVLKESPGSFKVFYKQLTQNVGFGDFDLLVEESNLKGLNIPKIFDPHELFDKLKDFD